MTVDIKTQDITNLGVLSKSSSKNKIIPTVRGWIPSVIREGRETSAFSFDAQGFFGLVCKFLWSKDWASDRLLSLVAHSEGTCPRWPLRGTRQGQAQLSLASSCPRKLVRPMVAERRSYLRLRTEGRKNSPRNWSRSYPGCHRAFL